MRAKFGNIPLQVDANAAYSLDDSALLARLDPFDLLLIEQPLDYDDVMDHAVLQKSIKTPVCLDESIHTVRIARDAIDAKACRIINIKPGRVGGHQASIELHDLCAAHDIPVWHGGMLESGIGRAHNIHLASLPNFRLPGDIAASKRYYHPDLIEPAIDIAERRDDSSAARAPGLVSISSVSTDREGHAAPPESYEACTVCAFCGFCAVCGVCGFCGFCGF